jgi:hypothetical protein
MMLIEEEAATHATKFSGMTSAGAWERVTSDGFVTSLRA